MDAAAAAEPQHRPHDRDATARLGGWLFRHRTSIPLPVGLALLAFPSPARAPAVLVPAGLLAAAAGEALRLWAVRHIGAISRTRSDRLGPVVATGPFAHVRNPIYVGNIALWLGFALAARLPWAAAGVGAVVGLEYHAIVRWEERLLEARHGDTYRAYTARVPRWMPARAGRGGAGAGPFSWRETLFSERGTLAAIAAGFALLWLKRHLW